MTDSQHTVQLIATLEDGDIILQYEDGRLERAKSQTDWARLAAMTEEEIEKNALDDPDNPPLDEAFFRAMQPIEGSKKTRVTMFLDDDILRYFRRENERGYQTRINAVLRRFVDAKR